MSYIVCKRVPISIFRTLFHIFEVIVFKFFNKLFLRKKILFISFGGKQYSDNPRAISEYLHKVNHKLKLVWLFKDPKKTKCPKYLQVKKMNKLNLLFELATSKVWIDNDTLILKKQLLFLKKNRKQLYIQTWHGDKGIKRCYYLDKNFKQDTPFPLEIEGQCDYVLTGSSFGESMIRSTFHYTGAFLKIGSPRNDCLFNSEKSDIEKIKTRVGVGSDEMVLTYAPTFKENSDLPFQEKINLEKIRQILKDKTGQNWAVICRKHHHKSFSDVEMDHCINGNDNFVDMSEVLQITDLLITDYSSCAGDFTSSNRPSILYVNDLEQYNYQDRGTLFDLKKSPFLSASNNDELINILNEFDFNNCKTYCDKINNFYGNYEDGNACAKVCDLILERLNIK